MEYKPHDGIALLQIGDSYLLAPTRIAFEDCPGILRLSTIEVIFWKRLSSGASISDLYRIYGELCFKKPEEVREQVDIKLKRLFEKGFLVISKGENP